MWKLRPERLKSISNVLQQGDGRRELRIWVDKLGFRADMNFIVG
jgi:hypothetical protein